MKQSKQIAATLNIWVLLLMILSLLLSYQNLIKRSLRSIEILVKVKTLLNAEALLFSTLSVSQSLLIHVPVHANKKIHVCNIQLHVLK